MDLPDPDRKAVGSSLGSNGREHPEPALPGSNPSPRGWRARLMSLRAQLIVPYVLLTLATAMVGTFIVTRLVTPSVHERFVNQLYEAGRGAADGIVGREGWNLETLPLVPFSAGVAQAMEARDEEALLARVQPVAANVMPEAL